MANNTTFLVSHILGQDNSIADALSRAHLGDKYEKKLDELIKCHNAKLVEVTEDCFTLQDFRPYSEQHAKDVKKPLDREQKTTIAQ